MSRVLKFPAYIINNKNYKKITETFHPVDLHLVHEILNRVELDFYPKHGFFSYSDHQKICEIAVGKFLEKMALAVS